MTPTLLRRVFEAAEEFSRVAPMRPGVAVMIPTYDYNFGRWNELLPEPSDTACVYWEGEHVGQYVHKTGTFRKKDGTPNKRYKTKTKEIVVSPGLISINEKLLPYLPPKYVVQFETQGMDGMNKALMRTPDQYLEAFLSLPGMVGFVHPYLHPTGMIFDNEADAVLAQGLMLVS